MVNHGGGSADEKRADEHATDTTTIDVSDTEAKQPHMHSTLCEQDTSVKNQTNQINSFSFHQEESSASSSQEHPKGDDAVIPNLTSSSNVQKCPWCAACCCRRTSDKKPIKQEDKNATSGRGQKRSASSLVPTSTTDPPQLSSSNIQPKQHIAANGGTQKKHRIRVKSENCGDAIPKEESQEIALQPTSSDPSDNEQRDSKVNTGNLSSPIQPPTTVSSSNDQEDAAHDRELQTTTGPTSKEYFPGEAKKEIALVYGKRSWDVADQAYRKRNYPKALEKYIEALKFFSIVHTHGYHANIANAHFLIANTLDHLDQSDDAMVAYAKSLSIRLELEDSASDRDVGFTYYNVGMIEMESGELQAALKSFEVALEHQVDNPADAAETKKIIQQCRDKIALSTSI